MTGHVCKAPVLPEPSSLNNHKPMVAVQSLEWDWDVEHQDRRLENKADATLHNAHPFQVDRSVLKDVVREKSACPVARIKFLSSGTSGYPLSYRPALIITYRDIPQGWCAQPLHVWLLLTPSCRLTW